jgi:hypothetical protein
MPKTKLVPNVKLRAVLEAATPDERRTLAARAHSSVKVLYHIANGNLKSPSAEFAQRLVSASLTLKNKALWLTQQDICKACARCPLIH